MIGWRFGFWYLHDHDDDNDYDYDHETSELTILKIENDDCGYNGGSKFKMQKNRLP